MPKAYGDGSLFQRKDGRWQASLHIDGKRKTAYGKTRKEARDKLRALEKQVETSGALPTGGQRTVNDLLEAWLENAPNLKPSTIAKHRWFLDTRVRPVIGEVRLERITPDRIQQLYTGLTSALTDKAHRLLHRAFSAGVMWGWLAANPCERVLKPAYKPQPRTLWSREELEVFLEETKGHTFHPLWVLLLATGCRLGEALALQWDDLDLDVGVMHICRTLHRIDGEWVTGSPKAASSRRPIQLPDVAVEVLRRQREQLAGWREAAADQWEDWGLVFPGENGRPLYESTVGHSLKRVCKSLNLPDVTPHGLRHMHASLLLDEGVPITAVSARLGHANPQVTLKVYAHSLAGQDLQAARAIGDVLRSSAEDDNPERPANGDEEA